MNRARTPQAKDSRRKLLLKTALEEFYENGFSAARMDDIADRAGVSKGTIYLYFQSKEAVFLSLIEEMTSPNIAHLETIAETAPSIREAIANVANFGPYIMRETDLPKLMKVMIAEARTFPEIAEHYRLEVLERILAVIVKLLEKARDRDEIEFEDASTTARLIMAPIAFAGIWTGMFGKEGPAALDVETLLASHAQMMLKALAPERED